MSDIPQRGLPDSFPVAGLEGRAFGRKMAEAKLFSAHHHITSLLTLIPWLSAVNSLFHRDCTAPSPTPLSWEGSHCAQPTRKEGGGVLPS